MTMVTSSTMARLPVNSATFERTASMISSGRRSCMERRMAHNLEQPNSSPAPFLASVMLYTDGITQARNGAGELFGCSRLCAILRSMHERRPEEIIDAVRSKVAEFTGSRAMVDDVTMVIMKAVSY